GAYVALRSLGAYVALRSLGAYVALRSLGAYVALWPTVALLPLRPTRSWVTLVALRPSRSRLSTTEPRMVWARPLTPASHHIRSGEATQENDCQRNARDFSHT